MWMGIVMIRPETDPNDPKKTMYLSSCYRDDDDAVCDTSVVDWVYAIRSMNLTQARVTWTRLLKGQDPPET